MQEKYINKFTKSGYTYFAHDVPKDMPHLRALLMIPKILEYKCKPKKNELIVVFDSDCFPINTEWVSVTQDNLKGHEFTAVQRLENPHGYRGIAHPCFCAWYHGTDITFSQIAGNPYIKKYEKRKWKAIHRTNAFNYHRQLYAIYGNIVYHHGAGSRNVNNQPFFHDGLKFYDYIFNIPKKFIQVLRGEISPYEIDSKFRKEFVPPIPKCRKL